MQRLKRGDSAIQPNIYLQRWFLSFELEKNALDYNSGYWGADGASANGNIIDATKMSHDLLLFRYQRTSHNFENATIATNNCQE